MMKKINMYHKTSEQKKFLFKYSKTKLPKLVN